MEVSERKLDARLRDRRRAKQLREYAEAIAHTDTLPKRDIKPVLLGLFGEVGSVLAAAKKLEREGEIFAGYRETQREELGDALWYFTTLCNRLGVHVHHIFAEAESAYNRNKQSLLLPHRTNLIELGKAAAVILDIRSRKEDFCPALCSFAFRYNRALNAAYLRLPDVIAHNVQKVTGRFLDPDFSKLPRFDEDFDGVESFPKEFEIFITQRQSGKSYLQYNGVFIGDPLTDNIADRDGYRFHDVFHLSHAAILNWSPVFRALLKKKRKSRKRYDEEQDSGRAIVVEEGLTAWIFSRAKELRFFCDQKSISFDMLKTIGQFVHGYEVDRCPLNLWEHAILEGYKVFRKVHENNGGIVYGNLSTRVIKYKPMRKVVSQ